MLSRLFARREPQARPLFALGSLRLSEKVHWLASKGLIDADQVDPVNEYDAMRYDCLLTDAFDMDLKDVNVHAERPVM